MQFIFVYPLSTLLHDVRCADGGHHVMSDEYVNILISFLKANAAIREMLMSISISCVFCKTNIISFLGLIECMQPMVKIYNVNDNVT